MAILVATLLGGCGKPDDHASAPANPAASFLPASEAATHNCGDGGALKTTLYGALSGEIEWHSNDMQCEGMPRPAGAGARLRFAGKVGDDAVQLAFIIALPDLEQGIDGVGFKSNVTVIDEGSSRFFSTPDLDSCWTDIAAQAALNNGGNSDDGENRFAIEGILYCISPLPEMNGDASISIPELHFSGQLDWDAK